MKFEAAIFDLDGTLLDSLRDIADAANQVLIELGKPTHSIDEYRYLVGDGVAVLFQRALSDSVSDLGLRQDCMRRFEAAYACSWNNHSRPYDGIVDVVQSVKSAGLRVGILSNKPDAFTKKCAEYFFRSVEFDMVLGHSERFPRKPDPASGLWMAMELGVSTDRIAYVGDTNTDMKTAVNAGFHAIGVSWGFRPEKELRECGAVDVAHSPADLEAMLLS